MPKQTHHTAPVPTQQVEADPADLWREEVVPRLPVQLVEKAKELKAFERTRGLADPFALLRGILAYVLCAQASSFRRLGAWAVLVQVATISDTAWRKHLVKASAWLLWLLGALLAVDPCRASKWRQMPETGRVLLIDATRLREPGGCGVPLGCIAPMICRPHAWCKCG